VVWNGSGYGHLNDQHYYILRHKLNKYDIEHIEIKLERKLPELVTA